MRPHRLFEESFFAGLDEVTLAGALAAILVAGGLLVPFHGEAFEWAQYLVLGAFVPVTVLCVARGWLPIALRRSLGVLGIGAALLYIGCARRWVALPLGMVQVLLTAVLVRAPVRAVDLVVAVAAWSAGVTMQRSTAAPSPLAGYLSRPQIVPLALTVVGFTWVVTSMALARNREKRPPAAWHRLVTAAAVGVLGLESLRADYLFDAVSLYHWGAFIAPAEVVRQGGWLLWDVPAMYGPLATLAIAAVPTTSVWDGFFLLNALACLVSGMLVFTLLREWMDPVLALVLTLCTVLWLPGARFWNMGGPVLVTPSGGPFRFVWCQLLLVVAAARPRHPAAWVGACLLWLVGCLWSSESGLYCSLTWLPAYTLLVWGTEGRARWRWLTLPPLLAAGALVLVAAYYLARLGHFPDWYAYAEASLGVRGGVVALPIEPWGPVAVLLLMLMAVATAIAIVVARAERPEEQAPCWAALGLLWAAGSYFVGRSHAVVVTALLPTLFLIALVVLRELRAGEGGVARVVPGAIAGAALLLALHDPSGWVPRHPLATRWALRVDPQRPTMDADLTALMRQAGITPAIPVVFYSRNVMPAWPSDGNPRGPSVTWLPVQPLTELLHVSEERRPLYVARFVARARTGGWLIENTLIPPAFLAGGGPWFFAALAHTHRQARQLQVGFWRATLYEPVGE
jgi:hypothetical protein